MRGGNVTVTTLSVDAEYCFGPEPCVLSNLARVNFVFAPNGSGKTTMSNALVEQPLDAGERATWKVAPSELPIRVFNEKYRARVLQERVKGIFTIGEKAGRARNQIAELHTAMEERRNARKSAKEEIGSDSDPKARTGLLAKIADERRVASEILYYAHKQKPEDVQKVAFAGVRSVIDTFGASALEKFSALTGEETIATWSELETRARTLVGDRVKRDKLPTISTTRLVTEGDITDLQTEKTTTGDGRLAALIQRLGHQDWVSEGRTHLARADGVCPFCQQHTELDLEQELATYFAGGFDDALAVANEMAERAATKWRLLENELDRLTTATEVDDELDSDALSGAISTVRTHAKLLSANLEARRKHPTRGLDASDVDAEIESLVQLITNENDAIAASNALIENAAAETEKIKTDAWTLLISEDSHPAAIKACLGREKTHRRRVSELEESIRSTEEADRSDKAEIDRLRATVSNTTAVAERINQTLTAMGFYRFRIKVEDELTGEYRIVRRNGTSAVDDLSEGEKSFICFIYFWESLKGSAESGGLPEEVVAVIDDPISSLDSDTLFIVAAFIRGEAAEIAKDASSIRQLIVLTHNTQFHHEASYTNKDWKREQRCHFRLLRDPNGFTYAKEDGTKSKIRGTYPRLWDSVVEAARSDDESDLVREGVVNISRRIVEGYFATMGARNDFRAPPGLGLVEQRIVDMFHIWASAGSHTIIDDIDQTIDVRGTHQFLKLMHTYFSLMSHQAHFDMMIESCGGRDLLEPGAIFGPLVVGAQVGAATDH